MLGGEGCFGCGAPQSDRLHRNDRNRRVSPIAVRPGEGLLTEPTAQPRRQEPLFVPHICHSGYPSGSAQLGGERSFATYPSWCTGARREADADAVEVDDLDRQVVALIRWSSSRAWMFGLGEWSPEKRASRSWPVIVYAAGLIQPKAAPAW